MSTLLALLLTAHVASAGEISVVGSLVREASLQPGAKTEGVILVRNNDNLPREIVVRQSDYRFFADGTNDLAEPGSLVRSNSDWVQFSPDQLLVPPNTTASVYYSVQAPNQAELDGTYWSLLLVEALPLPAPSSTRSSSSRGVQVQTVIRYGIQMITDLEGDPAESLSFDSVTLRQAEGQTTLVLDIANTGARQLTPHVWIDLFNSTGSNAGRVEADRRSRLLPGCSTRYLLDLSDLPPGEYAGLAIADAGTDQVFGADYTLDLR